MKKLRESDVPCQDIVKKKKIKFWVVSCSLGVGKGSIILDTVFYRKKDAETYPHNCHALPHADCSSCDAQIHKCEIERKP